jgi:hypothetical protein
MDLLNVCQVEACGQHDELVDRQRQLSFSKEERNSIIKDKILLLKSHTCYCRLRVLNDHHEVEDNIDGAHAHILINVCKKI